MVEYAQFHSCPLQKLILTKWDSLPHRIRSQMISLSPEIRLGGVIEEAALCIVGTVKSFEHKSHTGGQLFPCSECGKCFPCKRAMVIHQRTHTGERPFVCTECGKGFACKRSLVHHQIIHRPDKQFPCSECDKSFGSKSRLILHQKIHTGEKPFSCSECGKFFRLK
ncbi:gastrula zinc finger protein XlCGF67.1-like [Pseudophryne corroboree]|uniref:gastrula zinc finger protein XlCGF67.1-like n=1 Tax=Pseudophryne corroboree TaxID=495146 RepID=UPI0030817509